MNSFDDVVKRYNEIAPIRRARAAENLRPIGSRSRWYERIIKINDNKYVLGDGSYHLEQTAPITWERKADGDYLTVRSYYEGGHSISRYRFLDRWLPSGMRFRWGAQHHISYKGEEYRLPKFVTEWVNNTLIITDDKNLVFKHEGGEFKRVGKLNSVRTRCVDKEAEKDYKPKIKALWDWMQVVLPVLGESLVPSRHEYAESLTGYQYWCWRRNIAPDLAQEILNDEEHPKRVAFAACLAIEIEAVQDKRFSPTPKSFSKMKQVIRKICKFYTTEMV